MPREYVYGQVDFPYNQEPYTFRKKLPSPSTAQLEQDLIRAELEYQAGIPKLAEAIVDHNAEKNFVH